MKIAVNSRFLLPRLEGIGHYTSEIIDDMSKSHPEDEFHIILDRDHHRSFMNRKNVIRHVLSPPARHPILWYYWYEHKLPALLQRINPDVFFSPDGYMPRVGRIPGIMTIHDLAYLRYPEGSRPLHRKYLDYYMTRYIDRADVISCVSRYTRNDVLENFPQSREKLRIVPNGVSSGYQPLSVTDIAAFRDKWTAGHPYFLHLGSIHPRKNISRLIRAFDLYKSKSNDEMYLVLAGRMAWNTGDVRKAINASPYRKYILHLDNIDAIIYQLVGAATAMCYVSLFEGFGIPVLEAMAAGVPVITSKNTAMEEIGGSAAICIDPRDIKELSDKMIDITHDEKRKQSMIVRGRQLASQYTWHNTAELIYNQLVKISSGIRN